VYVFRCGDQCLNNSVRPGYTENAKYSLDGIQAPTASPTIFEYGEVLLLENSEGMQGRKRLLSGSHT